MADEDKDDDFDQRPRPFWSGVVSFGLVSLAVSLYPATRGSSTSLRMVDANGDFLSRRFFGESGDQPLEKEDIVRGYETEKDHFVLIEDDELEALSPDKSREIDLGQFVTLDELQPMHFERAYFLVPDGGTTKAYRLLARVMEQHKRAGIASFVMRGQEYLCAIIAEDGILRVETLRFAAEVRSPDDIGLPAPREVARSAVQRFGKAIRSLQTEQLDRQWLENEDLSRTQIYAESKLKKGKEVIRATEEQAQSETTPASEDNVIDLLQVLRERLKGTLEQRRDTDTEKENKTAIGSKPRSRQGQVKSELGDKTRAALYAIAQRRQLVGRSTMTRKELLQALDKNPS